MKILLVGDVHFSQYSSIVRKRGEFYSKRLENCIRSLKWVEELSWQTHCDSVVYLGDFFDKPDLNAEEITALQEISWCEDVQHIFLTGNHELGGASYSSAQLMHQLPFTYVIDYPAVAPTHFWKDKSVTKDRVFLIPYLKDEAARISAEEKLQKLWNNKEENTKLIVLSHNDLKGVQMGQFISKEGLDVDLISNNCDLFINGHLHNGEYVRKNVLNIGNLTGQNFSEDANQYGHKVILLNTDTLEMRFIENPYAFNFYKEEITSTNMGLIDTYKEHAIVSIRCSEDIVEDVRNKLQRNRNVEEFRIVAIPNISASGKIDMQELLSVDHIQQFKKYIQEHLDCTDALLKELQEI